MWSGGSEANSFDVVRRIIAVVSLLLKNEVTLMDRNCPHTSQRSIKSCLSAHEVTDVYGGVNDCAVELKC